MENPGVIVSGGEGSDRRFCPAAAPRTSGNGGRDAAAEKKTNTARKKPAGPSARRSGEDVRGRPVRRCGGRRTRGRRTPRRDPSAGGAAGAGRRSAGRGGGRGSPTAPGRPAPHTPPPRPRFRSTPPRRPRRPPPPSAPAAQRRPADRAGTSANVAADPARSARPRRSATNRAKRAGVASRRSPAAPSRPPARNRTRRPSRSVRSHRRPPAPPTRTAARSRYAITPTGRPAAVTKIASRPSEYVLARAKRWGRWVKRTTEPKTGNANAPRTAAPRRRDAPAATFSPIRSATGPGMSPERTLRGCVRGGRITGRPRDGRRTSGAC